ncbi:MAG: S8 family serine peptidase [Lentisphaerae bacterium]|nr:S8 family serine peptidase [Lentisphaerota bacterium]
MKRTLPVLLVFVAVTWMAILFHRASVDRQTPPPAVVEEERPARSDRPVGVIRSGTIPYVPPVAPAVRTGKGGPAAPRVPGGPEEGVPERLVEEVPESDTVPNEFLLGFFSESDQQAFIELARKRGVTILDTIHVGHAVRVRVDRPEQIFDLLKEGPVPVNQSPNYYARRPSPLPEEPREPQQEYVGFDDKALPWLGVLGYNNDWGKGVVIAVLDTGVSDHPLLAADAVTRLDIVRGTGGEDAGFASHGTAVASLIVGVDKQVRGIAPAAELLAVRVLSADGTGDAFTLARGIVAAVEKGANVINACLGTSGDCFVLREAVAYAARMGVIVVAAAGNGGVEGVQYPARYDGVVGVGAVDAIGRHLYFSNRGPEIDLVAPGVAVTAAGPDDGTVAFSGTSAAVPFVSGAIAAVLSRNPDLSAEEAATLLFQHADDEGAPGKDDELGHGILNMRRVLDRDVKGVYDVAVALPHVREPEPGDRDLVVVAFAENRGTEDLDEVRLHVEVDEETFDHTLYNLVAGQSASRECRADFSRVEQAGKFTIIVYAVIEGQQDVSPLNNGVKTTFSMKMIEE